jgi:hypothetical protein
MLVTKVTNDTGKELILKEGTAGIKRILAELPDKKTYKISVDSNATYREYWCAEKNDDPNAVVLSSDDCQEFKEVTIKRTVDTNSQDVYSWEGVKRDGGKVVKVVDDVKFEQDTPISGPSKGIWKKITGFFKPAAHQQIVDRVWSLHLDEIVIM